MIDGRVWDKWRFPLAPMAKVTYWESTKNMHPILYRFMLEQSRFTLCPWGGNPETLRLYEALELGSIPIARRWPFKPFQAHQEERQ